MAVSGVPRQYSVGSRGSNPSYQAIRDENPSYDDVCTGRTGHAEAAQIEFDPTVISFEKLLDVFWHTHDPTTLNRQGNDVGTQYRSAIFYHNDEQRRIAENSKRELDDKGTYKGSLVTEIVPFKKFYIAEDTTRNTMNSIKTLRIAGLLSIPRSINCSINMERT